MNQPSSTRVGTLKRESARRRLVLLTFLLSLLPLGIAFAESVKIANFWWLAPLTLVCSLFGIRFPLKCRSGALTLTLSDCFIFLALFFYGVGPAILVAALDAVTVCLKECWGRIEKLLFNVGQMALSVYIAGSAFWWARNGQPLLEMDFANLPGIILQLLACAVLYYTASSFMIGLVIRAGGGLPLYKLFASYLLKLSPSALLCGLAALVILSPLAVPLQALVDLCLIGPGLWWSTRQATVARQEAEFGLAQVPQT